MGEQGQTLTIRSFRLAFELERRIHRIDRYRIPLPYGLPLRSAAYAAVALLGVLAVSRLPVIGSALHVLPWPIRFGALPVALAQLMTQVQLDGRPAHEAIRAWVRVRLSTRRLVAFEPARAARREYLDALTIAPDERDSRYRSGVVEGEGVVILRRRATATPRGRRLVIAGTAAEPAFRAQRVALKPGQRVVIR
jgi:hypothetical protein